MKTIGVFVAGAVMAAWPGAALAVDTMVEVVNNSSQAVEQMVVFHVDDDGSIIDDVIGGIFEPIAPGASARSGPVPCQASSIYVKLADGEELSAQLDTCTDNRLVVSD